MAVLALTDGSITIYSVLLSSLANSVSINYEIDAVESTGFGSGGHVFIGGMQNNSVEISMMQDFATAKTEATVYGLVGTTTTLIIKPTSSATGATNPAYTITGTFLAAHTPVAGAVGELATTTLSFTGGVISKAVA